MKAKASSPKKVLYLPEDEEEEETDTRGRKSGELTSHVFQIIQRTSRRMSRLLKS